MKISIVIPCLNEEETITEAIDQAAKALKRIKTKGEILVADNGSTDGSQKKVKATNKARIIHVPIQGYGAALHWGILKSRGDYVFFADADLSYNFNEVLKFIKLLPKKPDLVLGSRFRGTIEEGSMPSLHKHFGTPFLTQLIRIIYKMPITDCNSGMRLVKKHFYKKLQMRNSGMEWASELIIRTALKKGRYKEVPINFGKAKRSGRPHLIPWADGWRHLKAIILLKPNSLLVPLGVLLLLTFFSKNIHIQFFLFLMDVVLFLSYLAAKLLHFALNNVSSRVVSLVQGIPIALLGVSSIFLWFLYLVFFPIENTEEKFMVSSVLMIFNMWVFLVETIKTHLINRLPDRL